MENSVAASSLSCNHPADNKYKFTKEEINALFNKFVLKSGIEFIEQLVEMALIKLNEVQKKNIAEYSDKLYKDKSFVKKMTKLLGSSILLEYCQSKQSENYEKESSYLIDLAHAIISKIYENTEHYNDNIESLPNFEDFSNLWVPLGHYLNQSDTHIDMKEERAISFFKSHSDVLFDFMAFIALLHSLKISFLNQSEEKESETDTYMNIKIEEEAIPFFTSHNTEENKLPHGKVSCFTLYKTESLNKKINNLMGEFYYALNDKIKNDCSILTKICYHVADPVLNTSVALISIVLLPVSIYARVSKQAHNVPVATIIAQITTTIGSLTLLNNMIFHLSKLCHSRSIEFLRASVILDLLQSNKILIKKYDELLMMYKIDNRKKFSISSITLFISEFFFRGLIVSLPFNLVNVPDEPAYMLGIALFTGFSILPTTGVFEFISARTMLKMNLELKEFINDISSLTQDDLNTLDVKTLYESIMHKHKSGKKSEKKYYAISLSAVLLASTFSTYLMLYNAINYDIADNFSFLNTTLSTNETMFGNISYLNGTITTDGAISIDKAITKRTFLEKLYYNQLGPSIILNGFISLVCKIFSVAIINHNFKQDLNERSIVKQNSSRFACAFGVLCMLAFCGDKPGIPDASNVFLSLSVFFCALFQNTVTYECKFQLQDAKIEELKYCTEENAKIEHGKGRCVFSDDLKC